MDVYLPYYQVIFIAGDTVCFPFLCAPECCSLIWFRFFLSFPFFVFWGRVRSGEGILRESFARSCNVFDLNLEPMLYISVSLFDCSVHFWLGLVSREEKEVTIFLIVMRNQL